jgi:UDP-galactopyranose mutase
MRDWKPIFVENSWVPRFLSYFAPISIGAIVIGFIVFGRNEFSDHAKQHEIIHFQQNLETLFVGGLLLYIYDYLHGWLKYRDGRSAYYKIRAEQEAYKHEGTLNYLQNRKRWRWISKFKV